MSTLAVHESLASLRRVAALGRPAASLAAWEIAALVGVGALAAVVQARLDLHLGIPGHAIVLSVFPAALGVALVPRRGAGSVMSASSLAAALLLRAGGLGARGAAAMVSLVLTGVLLDAALAGARSGARLYAGFVLAGLGANAAALVVRVALPFAGGGGGGGGAWLGRALVSYPLCGALAGLLSAALWFHLRARRAAAP